MNTRLLTIVLAGCLAAGCAKKNGASIEAIGFCAYTSSGPDCAPSSKCGRYYTGIDTYYLFAPGVGVFNPPLGYFVEVQNQLARSDAAGGGALNTHDAYVEGSSLSYEVDVSQSATTPAFSLPDDEAGTIEMRIPAGGGSGTPWLTVLPPATLQRLADNIDAGDSVLLTIDVSPQVRLQDQKTITNAAPVKYWVEVVNAVFGGYTCPKATQVVTDMCGVWGDDAVKVKCEDPTAPASYTIGGAVAGLSGTTLTITCTIDGGTPQALPDMTAPGTYSCGSAAAGASWTISLTYSGGTQTCTFDSSSGTTASGTVGSEAITEAITCGP